MTSPWHKCSSEALSDIHGASQLAITLCFHVTNQAITTMPSTLRRPRCTAPAFAPFTHAALVAAGSAALAAALASLVEARRRAQDVARRTPRRGRLVAAATPARSLHVMYAPAICAVGDGGPVNVVLEAGANSWAPVWDGVVAALGGRLGVLRYDRAGFGGSEVDLREGRGVEEAAEDLVAAIRNGGAKAPYVLVAHSLGALFVNAAVGKLGRDEVMGIVYVDAASLDGIRAIGSLVPKSSPPAWLARLLGGLGVLRAVAPAVLRVYYDSFDKAMRGEALASWARGDWLLSYTREWAAALSFAGGVGGVPSRARVAASSNVGRCGNGGGGGGGDSRVWKLVRRRPRMARGWWRRVERSAEELYQPGWLGDMPISVIVPDIYSRTPGMRHVGDIQRRVGQFSSDAMFFEPKDCGHFVQIEQPEVVAEAVWSVVRRAGARKSAGSGGGSGGFFGGAAWGGIAGQWEGGGEDSVMDGEAVYGSEDEFVPAPLPPELLG